MQLPNITQDCFSRNPDIFSRPIFLVFKAYGLAVFQHLHTGVYRQFGRFVIKLASLFSIHLYGEIELFFLYNAIFEVFKPIWSTTNDSLTTSKKKLWQRYGYC